MNINWTKFWTQQLPFCFRKTRILALIAALCAIIARLWSDWTTWGERARQRAAYTWQVFWLERLVWLEMGVVIIIEPADGRPFDFVVNVSSITSAETYDESRLRGLIDRYKLAGKSYRIVDSAIVREVRFINHFCERTGWQYAIRFANYVCEKGQYIYETSFINHVCEKIEDKPICTIWLDFEDMGDGIERCTIRSTYPVASDIMVYCKVNAGYGTFTLYTGEQELEMYYDLQSSFIGIESITPTEDDTYIYQ